MPLTQDDKDEIRHLITQEVVSIVKGAVNAVTNRPIQAGEASRHFMEAGDAEQREVRKKIAMEVGKSILESVEDAEREANARIVEKTDPERAERIRKLKPVF